MKIKLDENIGRRYAEPLLSAGHDLVSVAQQGLASAADRELIQVCRDEDRCLVTLDAEFGNPLLFTTDCNPRGVGSDPHMRVFALVAPAAGGYQELRSSVFGACSRITWHRTAVRMRSAAERIR